MSLNAEQRAQVELQAKAHMHSRYQVNIELAPGVILNDFIVRPKVLRPEVMSSLQLAQWLYFNNGLYLDKTVIDMGCGSGIQGVVAGLYGARQIIFSDISQRAKDNTEENVCQYGLKVRSKIVQGDLFENVSEKAHLIIFNHMFFSDSSLEEQISLPSFSLSCGELIHRFLEDAKNFLLPEGKIIMPYFHLAGPINDPGVQAPRHGYSVDRRWHMQVTTGLQKGWHSIYVIDLK